MQTNHQDFAPEPARLAFNEATRLAYKYAGSKKRANEIMQQVLIIYKRMKEQSERAHEKNMIILSAEHY
jgi:hypothetical protein